MRSVDGFLKDVTTLERRLAYKLRNKVSTAALAF